MEEYINEDLLDQIAGTHYNSVVSGTMSGLGILGTFLGLTLGMLSFTGNDIFTISDNIAPLLSGMKVAFHTYVYGIFFSLVFNLSLIHIFNKHLHLSANERALLTGALLHDFYLYDWHEKSTWHRWHGFSHPSRAWKNARRHFPMGAKEENIIRSHMWPLIPWQIPRSREAVIVCLADKCCSLYETTAR